MGKVGAAYLLIRIFSLFQFPVCSSSFCLLFFQDPPLLAMFSHSLLYQSVDLLKVSPLSDFLMPQYFLLFLSCSPQIFSPYDPPLSASRVSVKSLFLYSMTVSQALPVCSLPMFLLFCPGPLVSARTNLVQSRSDLRDDVGRGRQAWEVIA